MALCTKRVEETCRKDRICISNFKRFLEEGFRRLLLGGNGLQGGN
jgi:hypothetical protein